MNQTPAEVLDIILSNLVDSKDLRSCRLVSKRFLQSYEMEKRFLESREFDVSYHSQKYSQLLELIDRPGSTIATMIHGVTIWADSNWTEEEQTKLNSFFSKVLPQLTRLRKLSLHHVSWLWLRDESRRALTKLDRLQDLELFSCTFPTMGEMLDMFAAQQPGTVFLDIDSIQIKDSAAINLSSSPLSSLRDLVLGRPSADHGVISHLADLKPQLSKLFVYYAHDDILDCLTPLMQSSGEHLRELMIEGLWPSKPGNTQPMSFSANTNLASLDLRFYDSGPNGYIELPYDVLASFETLSRPLQEITLCFAVDFDEDRVPEIISPKNFDLLEQVLLRIFECSNLPTVEIAVNYMDCDLLEGFREMLSQETPELSRQKKISVVETGWI